MRIYCPKCGKSIFASNRDYGNITTCPYCKNKFGLPCKKVVLHSGNPKIPVHITEVIKKLSSLVKELYSYGNVSFRFRQHDYTFSCNGGRARGSAMIKPGNNGIVAHIEYVKGTNARETLIHEFAHVIDSVLRLNAYHGDYDLFSCDYLYDHDPVDDHPHGDFWGKCYAFVYRYLVLKEDVVLT